MLAWPTDAFAGLLLRVRTGRLTDASLSRLEFFFAGLLDLEAARLAGLVTRPVAILSSRGSCDALTGNAFFVGVLALALEGVVFLAVLGLVALAGVTSFVSVLALDLDDVVFFVAALAFIALAGVASFTNAANFAVLSREAFFAGVSLAGEAFFAALPACTRSAVAAASRALTEGVVRRGEALVALSGVAVLDLVPFAGDAFLLALAGVPFARAFAMTAMELPPVSYDVERDERN